MTHILDFFYCVCLNLWGTTGLHSFVWIKACRAPNPEGNLSIYSCFLINFNGIVKSVGNGKIRHRLGLRKNVCYWTSSHVLTNTSEQLSIKSTTVDPCNIALLHYIQICYLKNQYSIDSYSLLSMSVHCQ